jgi:cellulose synthase/poly-beta-1,6-N-acetylglucosamine synthase-like glycosyltransferase
MARAPPGFDDEAIESATVKKYKRGWRFNWLGILVFLTFLAALGFYIWVRVTKTLDLGSYKWYGILVFVVEMIGASTTILYGINLLLSPVPAVLSDDPDMPGITKVEVPYHVRILVPCYKESCEIVARTVKAAYEAMLPRNVMRTVYVLDDGKDPVKRKWFRNMGPDVVYVSGRKRGINEMNGKSCNLNNCLSQIYPDGVPIPPGEVVCVFDADQVANPDFFLKTLPLFDGGDDVGMVLSPQAFHNLNVNCDIFNHSNIQFWEYAQHGYDAMGFISCTGTNFLVRANCFQDCGWSPTYTLTEDYALGMEMKMRNWHCRYVEEYLAIGEAPEQVRNCFQQRSRWCKGHFQMFMDADHSPVFAPNLTPFMRLLYCAPVISYVAGAIATPLFIALPCVTVWAGVFPIVVSQWTAIGLTAYIAAQYGIISYVRSTKHIKPLWFANIANQILWWTFVKACWRALGSTCGKAITFKTTLKGASRFMNSSIGDLWVPASVFLFLCVSFGFGLAKVISGPRVITTLTLSLVWIVYSAIAPYLILHYTFIGRGTTLRLACNIGFYLSWLCGIAAIVLLWLVYPKPYSYNEALTQNFMFMESQQSGKLPANFSIPWRNSSYYTVEGANVKSQGYSDLTGGWFQGDLVGGVKMTHPTAFSMSMLAWGLLEFPQGFDTANQTQQALQTLKWGSDYLIKTARPDKKTSTTKAPQWLIAYQVGNLTDESAYWGRPEQYNGPRPAYLTTTWNGSSDIGGQMVAAWVSTALAYEKTDPAYYDTLMNAALNLYGAITSRRGSYSRFFMYDCPVSMAAQEVRVARGTLLGKNCVKPENAFSGAALVYYNSTSYRDDLARAAAWMYKATADPAYLTDAYTYYTQHVDLEGDFGKYRMLDYDNVIYATTVLLAELTDDTNFHYQAQQYLRDWLCTQTGIIKYTDAGRAFNFYQPDLAGTMNAAFLAAVYGNHITPNSANTYKYNNAFKAQRYTCFARQQMQYVLGDPGRSSVVGFGTNPPTHIFDRASSCQPSVFNTTTNTTNSPPCNVLNALYNPSPNPDQPVGALVSFETFGDSLSDVRTGNDTRVSIDFQPGWAGTMAGLNQISGTYEECLQGFGVLSSNAGICNTDQL